MNIIFFRIIIAKEKLKIYDTYSIYERKRILHQAYKNVYKRPLVGIIKY